jgi:hypothetical protein
MKHSAISFLLLCLFFISPGYSQIVIDDFNDGKLTNWVPGTSKYVLSGTGGAMKITATSVGGAGLYDGFGKTFSPLNMSTFSTITLRIMIPVGTPAPTVRMDVTDNYGFDSNKSPLAIVPVADGVYHEYTFNYKGKFQASYPSANNLNPASIVRVFIYLNPGMAAYTGSIYFEDLLLKGAQTPSIIPSGAVWKYLNNGTEPAGNWTDTTFLDASWNSDTAQFGYGDSDEKTLLTYGNDPANRYITSYFRKSFFITDTTVFKNLILNLVADDGGIVYLNGSEIFRYNMPAGSPTSSTLATTEITDPLVENSLQNLVLPEMLLDSGKNILAVEVHQASISSEDLSFDLSLTGSTYAQGLIRGPYLQSASENSIVIRWRTLQKTNGRVRYGSSSTTMNLTVDSTSLTTEHQIRITGLTAGTKYFYCVGTSTDTLSGADDDHYFITSPVKGTEQSVRIWALGDAGKTTNDQRNVGAAYNTYIGNNHTDVWMLLGDNAYNEGTDEEYQIALFENMFEETMKHTVLWPTPGNHDLRSYMNPGDVAPYYKIFSPPVNGEAGGIASGTKAYYSYDYANVHFISLDSYGTPRDSTAGMATWLKADLAANTQKWTIAYWHHPPYTKGSNDSDDNTGENKKLREIREQILPLLEKGGVDLVVNGHSHNYERSHMIHGHYGLSSTFLDQPHIINAKHSGRKSLGEEYYKNPIDASYPDKGSVYTVVGCSGFVTKPSKWDTQAGNLVTNAIMYKSLNQYLGSMAVEVNKDTLTAKFLDNHGVIQDDFTIIKDNTKSISLVMGSVNGIDDNNNTVVTRFSVYPNPSSNEATVRYSLFKNSKIELEVLDETGKKIESVFSGKQSIGDYEFPLNLTGKGSGLYFVNLKVDKTIYSRKIIRLK